MEHSRTAREVSRYGCPSQGVCSPNHGRRGHPDSLLTFPVRWCKIAVSLSLTPCFQHVFDGIRKLEKAFSRHRQLPQFARLADGYLKRGKVLRALDLCREGCVDFPTYAAGHSVLSRCYERRGELEKARTALDRALRLDPENPKGFFRLSR